MKHLVCSVLLFASLCSALWGQSPTPKKLLPSISLDAATKSGSAQITVSDYGVGASFRQLSAIEVQVKNYSTQPLELIARTYFFADRVTNRGRFIFSEQDKALTLHAGENTAYEVKSPELQASDAAVLKAARYVGWLVQILPKDGGDVIKQTASTSFIEDLATTPAFEDMKAAYARSHHQLQ